MSLAAVTCGLAAAALLCAGCMTNDPEKLHAKVTRWVPMGTPVEVAKPAMEKQGFHCKAGYMLSGTPSGPTLECRRTNHVINRTWVVWLYLQTNRVTFVEEQIFYDPLRMFGNMH